MTTIVSIALYLAAIFFSAMTGMIAEQHKSGSATKTQGKTGIVLTLSALTLAITLQVFA